MVGVGQTQSIVVRNASLKDVNLGLANLQSERVVVVVVVGEERLKYLISEMSDFGQSCHKKYNISRRKKYERFVGLEVSCCSRLPF